jgi:hypothetical protein
MVVDKVYNLMLVEVVASTPKPAGCAVNSPATCNKVYGSCIALKDGTNTTGGSTVGCFKYDNSGVEPGADQSCPAGFTFSWYTTPSVDKGRIPVLKECWKTNGGNANW